MIREFARNQYCHFPQLSDLLASSVDGSYQAKETPGANNIQHTEWNPLDSDGTGVVSIGEILTGGSWMPVELARKHGKPMLHLSEASGISVAEAALRRLIGKTYLLRST